jgi:hypothetical protein
MVYCRDSIVLTSISAHIMDHYRVQSHCCYHPLVQNPGLLYVGQVASNFHTPQKLSAEQDLQNRIDHAILGDSPDWGHLHQILHREGTRLVQGDRR